MGWTRFIIMLRINAYNTINLPPGPFWAFSCAMKGFHVLFVWGFCGSYLSEEGLSGTGKLDTRLMFTALKQQIVCDVSSIFNTSYTSTFGDNDRLGPLSLVLLFLSLFFSFASFFFQSNHLFAWMFKRGIITKAVNKLCVFHVQTIWSHKYICIETVFVTRVKHSQDSGSSEMATAGAQRIINNYIVNVQNGV